MWVVLPAPLVEQELSNLGTSPLGVLLSQAKVAAFQRRDSVGERVHGLRREIDEARLALARLRGARFK